MENQPVIVIGSHDEETLGRIFLTLKNLIPLKDDKKQLMSYSHTPLTYKYAPWLLLDSCCSVAA
jgi:hypothetical protein